MGMDRDSIIQKQEEDRLRREEQRWAYVKEIARRDGMSLARAASYYSIDRKVIGPDELSEVVLERKNKRKDKYEAADKFVKENVFALITPAELAELAGFSYPTALKYINDRPNHFKKVNRGQYEIRDPESDKKNEKKSVGEGE
jgi:hypothetical protein